MRRIPTLLACLLLPPAFKPQVLRALGHSVRHGARIGVSLLVVERLALEKNTTIGHFNIIVARRVLLRSQAYIGSLNTVARGMSLRFAEQAALGNRNKVVGGRAPRPYRPPILRLGRLAKITSDHYLEMAERITFGDYTTLAGVRSQIWTHGWIHDETGRGRVLITGPVLLGHNVYIGSGSIINCGVRIADAVSVGAGVCISKSLDKAGVYVSQPLRFIDRRPNERLQGLELVEGVTPQETHYRRVPS